MLHCPEKFLNGYCIIDFPIDHSLKDLVLQQNWLSVDAYFKKEVLPGARIEQFLSQFHEFKKIETLLSIRSSSNEWEEDGIWHDDGSRVFAFSLSLNPTTTDLKGGCLEIRKKDSLEIHSIPTPSYGTGILFLTGVHGYEHRTRQVTNGTRVMLVGWCSIEE